MILVLTTEAGDFSHKKFIDWLEFFNADYEILSGESLIGGSQFSINENSELLINNRNYSQEVNVVLNRRWLTKSSLPKLSQDEKLNSDLNKNVVSELYEIRTFLETSLINAWWVPGLKEGNTNKLSVLKKAKDIGLLVPSFVVTNSREKLLEFYRKLSGNVISKAIGNFQMSRAENQLINPVYTKVLELEVIHKLPPIFFPSLFQKMIVKKKELRILYFNSQCYSVEVRSQEITSTLIDSRKMENENVRLIRNSLPDKIQKLINQLMLDLSLDIGCIDFLVDLEDNYYFLEVNPVGQISGYSERTNLQFEKKVIEKLVQVDNEHSKRKNN